MVKNSPFFFDRRLALCVVLPLVIVTSTAGWRWNSNAQRIHEEMRQALDSMGLEDNLEELAYRFQKLEDDAKAKRWKSLATLIRYPPGPMQPVIGGVWGAPPPEENWELEQAARRFVDNHGSIFAEICELNQESAVISLVPDKDFLNQWLDSAADTVLISAGLNMVGCVALRDNDEARVLQTILDFYECRRTLRGVAPPIGAHVRFDLSKRALFLLKMGLERGLFGNKSLKLLQPILLEHAEVDAGWLAAIEFELAMHLAIMSGQAELRHSPEPSSPIATKLTRSVLPPASLLDRIKFLKLIRSLAEAPTDNLAAFQIAQLHCDVLFDELRNAGTRFDFDSTGFANNDTLADAFIADALRHRLAVAAIALQLYRIENGNYPNNLEEVAKDERLQPIGGKPMGYVQANSSATIWIANESPWITPSSPPLTNRQTLGARGMDQTVVWTLSTP